MFHSNLNGRLAVVTRLHMGMSRQPPTDEDLFAKVSTFYTFCRDSCQANDAILTVDATPTIRDSDNTQYSLVDAVKSALVRLENKSCSSDSNGDDAKTAATTTQFHVLPVAPWGKSFVGPLNACIVFGVSQLKSDWLCFVSAETAASHSSMQRMWQECSSTTDDNDNNTVLVVGAALPGHEYNGSDECTVLTGRTTPWNTLAVWNAKKLAMTGFQLISDGLLSDDAYGVEEVVCIALLQKLLGRENAVAKLVMLPDVEWNQVFDDPARKEWHEAKMKSKEERAGRQLEMLKLEGWVQHC